MSNLALLFIAALLYMCSATNNGPFQCDFVERNSNMVGGFVNGVLKYDWNGLSMSLTYTTSGTIQLYNFDAERGYGTGDTPFDDQFQFRYAPSCGCQVESLDFGFPPLFVGSGLLTPDAIGKNTALSLVNGLASVVIGADGFPISAIWADGRSFTYSNCASTTFSSSEFTKPAGCTCGKPIDIVVVLDRSSSIDTVEFANEKLFTQDLVAAFTYSDLEVNLGLTNFHTLIWDGPVTLLQGNNQANVATGASALQCAPLPQCIVYQGTNGACCGQGTSISAGIVNGVDMLLTASTTGIRANAQKVLIVFTDGYHNKVLKRDSQGNIVRDANQKPSGVPFTQGGLPCSELASSSNFAACSAGLLADLDSSVAYAVAKIPNISILSVGVGPIVSRTQLLHIALGIPANAFSAAQFSELPSLVDALVKQTCQQSPADPKCVGCCGFCGCSGCVAPDGCDPGNKCDDVVVTGTCCKASPKPPSACDQPDKCYTYSCDKNANGGTGNCTKTINPVKPNTTCAGYTCNPLDGTPTYTNLCPPQPKCLTDQTCSDGNACTTDTCSKPDSDPLNNFCLLTPVNCTGADKCFTYSCDPVKGCQKTAVPIPMNSNCSAYACDSNNGTIIYTDLCPIIPDCTADKDCSDNNVCTDDTCSNANDPKTAKCQFTPANFCDQANKCFTYACDPISGCQMTAVAVPPTTSCASYRCDPTTGTIVFTDLCPPQPVCTTDAGCDDLNKCTVDTCVISNTSNPLSAVCVNTPLNATACDDSNACTYDTCDPQLGCVHTNRSQDFCDDGNLCTIDSCDPSSTNLTFPCKYDPVVCSATDICHTVQCYPAYGCQNTSITCPVANNCSLSGCNATSDKGCYIETGNLTCGAAPPVALIGGLAGGAVAGIVVGALLAAGLLGGSGAYAFTTGAGKGLGAGTYQNPIYAPQGQSGSNPLNAH